MESNPGEGDDTEPQPKAQAKPKKMMKRPAAAPKASTKKRKGSADAGGEGTAVLEVEMAAPSKDGLETAVVPSGLSGEDQKANEAAETGDEKSHGKPKAKAKGKGRAKAKANVTPCGSPGEASDGEASDGNCTVHFDTNPLHDGAGGGHAVACQRGKAAKFGGVPAASRSKAVFGHPQACYFQGSDHPLLGHSKQVPACRAPACSFSCNVPEEAAAMMLRQ